MGGGVGDAASRRERTIGGEPRKGKPDDARICASAHATSADTLGDREYELTEWRVQTLSE